MSEREREFEITKHFAAVLRSHFQWTSCHTASDGSKISYCELGSEQSKTMTGDQVRIAGAEIERKYREKLSPI